MNKSEKRIKVDVFLMPIRDTNLLGGDLGKFNIGWNGLIEIFWLSTIGTCVYTNTYIYVNIYVFGWFVGWFCFTVYQPFSDHLTPNYKAQ